jgi:hypothetical protein
MPIEVPARIGSAVPDSALVARIRTTLMEAAAPVRPLPSNAALMALCVAVFIALALLLTLPVGFPGFARLDTVSRLIEYPAVLLLAFMLAGSLVDQMIPGTRRVIGPAAGVLVAVLLLSVTAALLFPGPMPKNFVDEGIPCLRLGALCAIPAGGLTWTMMRRGFAADPLSAAIAAGGLSGLLGVGVLALHCPILNAAHIIAWHVGSIVVAALFGALLGWSWSRRR